MASTQKGCNSSPRYGLLSQRRSDWRCFVQSLMWLFCPRWRKQQEKQDRTYKRTDERVREGEGCNITSFSILVRQSTYTLSSPTRMQTHTHTHTSKNPVYHMISLDVPLVATVLQLQLMKKTEGPQRFQQHSHRSEHRSIKLVLLTAKAIFHKTTQKYEGQSMISSFCPVTVARCLVQKPEKVI